MGTNEKLVPGQFLRDPVLRARDQKNFKINVMSKLASNNKNINEEIANV